MPNLTTDTAPDTIGTDLEQKRKPLLHFYHRQDLGKFPRVIALCRTWAISGTTFKTVEGEVSAMEACVICTELDRTKMRCPTCGAWIGASE